jgi:NDP-sugar pyrophosphorylase family protein
MASFSSTLVLMAGGLGKRMQDLTRSRPKHTLAVEGKPLFANALDRIIQDFRVERMAFRLAYRPEDFVRRWQEGEYLPSVPSILLIGHPTDGPIGAFVSSCCFLSGDTFVGVYGDVFFDVESFAPMLEFHVAHKNAMTVAIAHGLPTRRPSTLTIDPNGTLVNYCRKEMTDSEDYINAGLYVVERGRADWLFRDYEQHRVRTDSKVEYKEDELWRLSLNRPDRARFFPLPGRVVNVNRPEDLQNAGRLAKSVCDSDVG